ncbi:MAG TPA: DUF507 family protein [Candidatus Binatia bacterium]|nr:DUF507 family protein [Candidatus Binatia bacterium]
MRLTEAAASHLAHQALAALKKSGAQVRNERLALAEIKRALASALDRDPRIDETVRRRIASLARPVPVGSAEYEILYRQYYEQEARKHRR